MKSFAKNRLHSTARFSLVVFVGVALSVTLCADRVAIERGNQLPLTSLRAAAGSKPNEATPLALGQRDATPDAPGPWTVAAPYPTTIVRYGFAQTDTHFYVFGGVSDGTQVNNVNRMDIATGVWQSRAPMPFTSEAPTCALMASTGIVYCTQGDSGSGFASYNIATNSWTTLASIPGGDHYGSASGAFNGKVFVAGGTSSISNLVQVYNVATNMWSAGTAAPSVFLLAGYQQVGQFLYVVGGFDPTFANNATTWRLDMSSAPGVWSTGPAFTPQRADFGLAYDAGTNKLYALGGDLPNDGNAFNSTNLVDELDVGSWPGGSWMASPPVLLLPNRQANQAGFYGAGQIWSVGGIVGQTFQFLAEVQRRTNGGGGGGCTTGSWMVKAPYPVVIESPNVASNGTYLYAAGGFAGAASNAAYRYDPSADAWTPIASMPVALYATRAVYATNTNAVYVFGGYNGTVLNTTYKYNIASNTWTTGAPMPAGRYFPNLAYYAANGKIYVIGGFNSSFVEDSQTWEYDPVANTWNTSRANIPVAMAGSGTSISGQYIYLSGNWNGGSGSTLHYRYDIVGNSWAAMAPVPVAIYEPAAAAIAGKSYLIGGGNPSAAGEFRTSPPGITSLAAPATSYNTTYVYDIASNTWSNGPNTTVAHSFTAGAAIGGTLYVVAGFNGSADTSTVEALTVTCPCQLRVLVAYSDTTAPTQLQSEILAEPGVAAVDLFDAQAGTPTLGQLQQYQIVVPYSNFPFLDADTLGNNLADYVDGGGIVVQYGFSHYGPGQPYGVNGRWVSGNYNPYNYSTNLQSNAFSLGTFNAGHPLMAGVTTLNSNFGNIVTLASGATEVAANNLGNSLVAYRPLSGGHTTVGVTAYVGSDATQSGDWGRVIVNAGHWLGGSCAPVPSSAVSRKVHGAAGTFDVNLPLVPIGGAVGIEDRTGAVAGAHQEVITFATPVTLTGVAVTSGTGSATFSGNGTAVITVDLTGVTNAQRLGVTLMNVNNGTTTGDVMIPMGVLSGDTNANGSVNAGDVAQTKGQSGIAVGAGNFRTDVNSNGAINAGDVALVKSKSGTALPP